jgi:type I restriction enzyme S subunit
MKKGWKTVPLGELCDVLDHKRKPITKRDRDAGEYPYYGATGVLDYVAGYLFDEPLVLVGEDGAKWASGENTAFAVDGKIWVNNHAHVLRPHRAVLLDNWLIYHLNHSDLIEFVSGLTVPKLNQGCLREIPVPVPPLTEQQRIVGLLDKAFEGLATAKANAEKNIQNARALFESHLQSVFTQRGLGWVEKTLGDVFTTATGTTPPKNNADFYGDFMPLVKPPELCDKPFDSAPDGLSEAGAAVARTLPAKSILVSCIGNLGKIGLNTVPVAFNQQINAILPDETQAIPEFMFFQSLAPVFKEQLESLASGTTVPIVNKSKFNSVRVVLPPLPIQKPVVEQLTDLREETQRLARLYERKHSALEALKKSLLHQAFTGAL